ncbi:hypothetical protein DRJ48_00935 [Candidatus Woesearchaeota archaeon]|nr:endonuclease V [Candidatus Woesearchaeota archaeon]RLE43436.1 MAG: hypothetical protein DRJ48_00935 [Candidatus Woesearchaeota archaeon]
MDLRGLKQEQLKLAERVVVNNKIKKLKLVAGCDVLGMDTDKLVCCVTVLDYKSLKLVEHAITVEPVRMKYTPGFMGFSHGPIIVNTYLKLKQKPDVLLVKGHGIAHPRRIGLASQLGLQLNMPTIGIASKLLCGKVRDGKVVIQGEVRGVEMVTREFSKPVYVSPGHMVSLNKSVEIVQHCIKPPHKMPEPIFMAHKLAKRFKKKKE